MLRWRRESRGGKSNAVVVGCKSILFGFDLTEIKDWSRRIGHDVE